MLVERRAANAQCLRCLAPRVRALANQLPLKPRAPRIGGAATAQPAPDPDEHVARLQSQTTLPRPATQRRPRQSPEKAPRARRTRSWGSSRPTTQSAGLPLTQARRSRAGWAARCRGSSGAGRRRANGPRPSSDITSDGVRVLDPLTRCYGPGVRLLTTADRLVVPAAASPAPRAAQQSSPCTHSATPTVTPLGDRKRVFVRLLRSAANRLLLETTDPARGLARMSRGQRWQKRSVEWWRRGLSKRSERGMRNSARGLRRGSRRSR